MTLTPGTLLGHYEIQSAIGAGGMGEVYRACDTQLKREVALKVLPVEVAADTDRLARFQREAELLAALNHPHIAQIHGLVETEGVRALVMELVEGPTLAERIARGPMPLDEALIVAAELAEALEYAHEHGIIHRDLKPANIKLTPDGAVKVLDFGLAKALERGVPAGDPGELPTMTSPTVTEVGLILGTAAYMSPEQAEGRPADARSDVFSLGVVVYEMLCGARPFGGDTTGAVLAAILKDPPRPLRKLRPEVPKQVERIVSRCLEKQAEARYASARDLWRDLAAYQAKRSPASPLRRWAAAAALLIVIAVGALGVRSYVRSSRLRWVEDEALPQIARLLDDRRPVAALRVLRQAEQYGPSSPRFGQLKAQLFDARVSIQTSPPGASVYVRDYADEEDRTPSRWEFLGQTPLDANRLPHGLYVFRIVRAGSEETERALSVTTERTLRIRLPPLGEAPEGMILVPGTELPRGSPALFPVAFPEALSEFWLDRYEVTNRQYKEFIDRGGYQKPEYWKRGFLKGGKALTWEQAMAEFRDPTGRPGPATWELGTYPEGKADFPVGGVSWYEASAYAVFAGKSLPTAYHWFHAAGVGGFSAILGSGNFAGRGPARVGAYRGLGPFGTYDMAGNVKEWSSSPTGDRFYILGGGWNESSYLFGLPDARYPFDRQANSGFRCARYLSPLPEVLTGPVPFVTRDRRSDTPADDRAFQIYRGLHSYDKTDLKPVEEPVDQSSQYWNSQEITFQAAYGNERVLAHLYLPKNVAPPFQIVTFFPGADAFVAGNMKDLGTGRFDFIVRSGRALILPAYKGMLERGPGDLYHLRGRPNQWRDMNLQWFKDLGRSIDYLETRADIDVARLAFYGHSLGAAMAPRLITMESRFKVAVLVSGGSYEKVMPEVDAWNFAPRVRIPVLMVNGQDDFRFPLEVSQHPLFRLLGTDEKDKRLKLLGGGHDIVTRPDAIKEVLDWLDRYLGPVR